MDFNRKSKSKKKVILIIVILLAALVVTVGIAINRLSKKATELLENTVKHEFITEQYLVKSIGATGTVVSLDSKMVTGDLQGFKIDELFVEEGDYVEEGDILLVFESTDLEKDLEDALDKLKDAQNRIKIQKESQDRAIADAERNKNYQIDTAKDNIDKAQDACDKLVEQRDEAYKKLDELKSDEDKSKEEYDTAKSKVDESNKEFDIKKTEYDKARENVVEINKKALEAKQEYDNYKATKEENAGSDGDASVSGNNSESVYDEAKELELKKAYEDAKAEADKANEEFEKLDKDYQTLLSENTTLNNDLQTKETSYKTTKFLREQQENTINTLTDNIITANDSFIAANKSYDFLVKQQDSTVASVKSNKELSSLTSTTDMEQTQVDMYEEQLEKVVVTAPISGTVTSLMYDAGDKYMSGALMTIQDCSEYEIEAYVGEYDISDIEVGQKVLIKTEATRDVELEGIVDFISPTGMKVGTDVTYKIRIKLKESNDRLRLDMSASLSIITAESEKAITVPYNAIQEDEEGNTFIELINEDGTFNKIYTEVLMESNYYTEIKLNDNIKIGDKVRVIEEKALNPLEMLGVF